MASAEQPTDNGTLKPPESEVNASTTANATKAETAVTAADSDTVVKSSGTEEFPQHYESPAADAAETVGVKTETTPADKKWPGWPGDCVFRLVVPVLKVGSIIGRKGDLIKKMCEETRARIRVLDGPVGSPDRIVLISGKEEPEAPLSPAMDAVVRVFKRVSGLPEGEVSGAAAVAFCSIRLLVASSQAINLIGKQGSSIKLIQESSGASVRVLSNEEVQIFANSDERIVELQGEAVKVLKALEAVVGHLRKFLVDHSVLPLFEKSYNTSASQDRQVDTWADKTLFHSGGAGGLQAGVSSDYPLSVKRDSLFLDRETTLESQLTSPGLLMYGQDSGLSGLRSSGLGRSGGPIVTQVAQTMQIPLTYAEDIIGMRGANIQYIRHTSGAILSVQESRGLPDEITVEIKGTAAQVQTAQQLIQECINGPKEVVPGGYGKLDSSLRSSYSQLGSTSYSPSSFSRQSYGGYEPSGVGRYSSFRL